MKIRKIMAAVAVLVAAGGAQASALVTNGSFEHPGLRSWGIQSSIEGWTGGAYGIEIQPSGTVGGVSAFDGNQYVELDTTANSSMWQDLGTKTSSTYTLSFAYMARPDNAGGGRSNPIEVWWGGSKFVSVMSSTGGAWTVVEFYDLAALSSSTRLEFRAAGTSDSYGGFIDGIVVSAVPEPESYALLLAGLGLVAARARRRGKPTRT